MKNVIIRKDVEKNYSNLNLDTFTMKFALIVKSQLQKFSGEMGAKNHSTFHSKIHKVR